jgi:NAD(P)-dependent dehydrogenase (short-subunit alcohol dehydrogenase family)
MALHLARRWVGVIGTLRSEKDEDVKSAAAEIEANGGRAAMLRLDVSRTADFPKFAAELSETLKKTFGRSDFDYLVNNAGNSAYAPVSQTSEEQFDSLIGVHFKGPLFLTQALLPMIADGGCILNVSSGAVHRVSPESQDPHQRDCARGHRDGFRARCRPGQSGNQQACRQHDRARTRGSTR